MSELPQKIETNTSENYNEEIELLHDFYDIVVDKDKAIVSKIALNRLKIKNKLTEMGFCRFDTGDKGYRLVKIVDNKITITTEVQISDTFEDYINDLPDRKIEIRTDTTERDSTIRKNDILDVLYKNFNSYMNMYERLRPTKQIEIQEDSITNKYFFFKNTVVDITADVIQTIEYEKIKKMVWESSILERDFLYSEMPGMFEKFVENVTGKNVERKKSLMSLLGYLMHSNFECEKRMVVLTDTNMDNPDKPMGGTGKGIIGKSISMMMNKTPSDTNYIAIAGKTFDPNDAKKYITGDLNTKVIHIEDASRNMKLEPMYNDITDGATIRKHSQTPFTVFLKILLSINQTLSLDSVSDKRRVWIFELENYYNENFSPEHEFGCRFFESKWTSVDWNRFDSFMCRCVQLYLQKGIILVDDINYSNREIIEHTCEDFAYWFSEYLNDQNVDEKTEKEIVKVRIYDYFNNKYPEYKTKVWFSQKIFTKWCKIFLEKKHIPFCEIRSTHDLFILYPSTENKNKAIKQRKI